MRDPEREGLREIIADNVKRMMEHDDWTCYKLQKEFGMSARTIYSIIRKERMPNIYMLVRLADIFEVSVDYLLRDHTK